MSDITISNPYIEHLIKVPAMRQLFVSAFSFFINFDHLWLYIYHNRRYSLSLQKMFNQIRNLENIKWNLASQQISNHIVSFTQIQKRLNQKTPETPQSFYAVQQSSREFLTNNYKFFILNIPFVLVAFLFGRLLFKLFLLINMKNYFRDFSFKSYLIIIFLEGNSESFTYFLFSDLTTLFARSSGMKAMGLQSVLILFIMIIFLSAGPFILRYLQERERSQFLYDDCKNTLGGTWYFMVEFGLFNILLGSVHILAQNYPNLQLSLLLVIEIGFIGFKINVFLNREKFLNQNFKLLMSIVASFLRICIIVSMFIFQMQHQYVKDKVSQFQQICITAYLLSWIVSFLYSLIKETINVIKLISKKVNQTQRSVEIENQQKNQLKLSPEKEIKRINKARVTPVYNFPNLNIRKLIFKKPNKIRIKENKKKDSNFLITIERNAQKQSKDQSCSDNPRKPELEMQNHKQQIEVKEKKIIRFSYQIKYKSNARQSSHHKE